MRVDFINYNAILIADLMVGDTSLPISSEDAQILLDGMSAGDYTYLQVSGQLFTEVIKVTKSGSVLVVERGQCDSEECNFMVGDCIIHYVNAAECDGEIEESCACTICDLSSEDNSIIIDSDGCEIHINPELLDSTLCEDLGELDAGTLLAGDFLIAFRELDNGSRQCFRINTDDLCERLNACVGGGSGGPQGPQGPSGAQGPAGPVGAAGPAGADGVDGVDGAPGTDGADGAPGADGADGADGVDGAPGVSASSGDDWIDVSGTGVVTHNDPVAGPGQVVINLASITTVVVDAKGHIVSAS